MDQTKSLSRFIYVTAQVVSTHNEWVRSTQIPTFIIDREIVGATTCETLEAIVKKIVDPLECLTVHAVLSSDGEVVRTLDKKKWIFDSTLPKLREDIAQAEQLLAVGSKPSNALLLTLRVNLSVCASNVPPDQQASFDEVQLRAEKVIESAG